MRGIITITYLLFTIMVFGQKQIEQHEVSFKEPASSFEFEKGKQIQSIPIKIKTDLAKLDKYTLDVIINYKRTTLDDSKFKLLFKKINLSKMVGINELLIKINADTVSTDTKNIVLQIKMYKDDVLIPNKGEFQSHNIKISPLKKIVSKNNVNGFEFLSYVGTNFDLVDGIQANNLFFATNIYIAPRKKITKKNAVGFYLSIYGNRAFTQIDSTSIINESVRIEPKTDTTHTAIRTRNYISSKRVIDNIGAYLSPLFKIPWSNDFNKGKNLNLYYSPSLEFVYRRSSITLSNGNIVKDTLTLPGSFSDIKQPNNNRGFVNNNKKFNEYSFNAGIIGLFMALENKDISVRIHSSIGYSANYFVRVNPVNFEYYVQKKSDIFFTGRAWITEPKTGITLQAEVTNTAFNSRPFFAATISKAFHLDKISNIFSPITSR